MSKWDTIMWSNTDPNTFYDVERSANAIECKKCHGYAERVDCTEDECAESGCGRDTPGQECCARAFVCKICGARYAGRAEAPEME